MSSTIYYLGDKFVFSILTSDRDLGDEHAYPNVQVNTWQKLDKEYVCYLSPERRTLKGVMHVVNERHHDVVYINSMFGELSVYYFLLRRLNLVPLKPVILAPRGETDDGALAQKRLKKSIYVTLAKLTGLYKNVSWQASSEYEEQAIHATFPKAKVHIAQDLATPQLTTQDVYAEKFIGSAQILYLSRITPKKNLNYALERLANLRQHVRFDIYGPIDDAEYWLKCQQTMKKLPVNIAAKYCGVVPYEKMTEIFSKYHALFLPTLGENFGHVIVEALVSGCILLISDQTPWRNLDTDRVGWDIPLKNTSAFEDRLKQLVEMDDTEFHSRSRSARDYAEKHLRADNVVEASRQLFLEVFNTDKN